jgi:hypothetical protein
MRTSPFKNLLIPSVALVSALISQEVRASWTPTQIEDCFDLKRLPVALQPQARKTLLKALDQEALYTLASNLKPMSSGILTLAWSPNQPKDRKAFEDLQSMLPALQCGTEARAWTLTYREATDGKRYTDLYLGAPELMARTWSQTPELQRLFEASLLENPSALLERLDGLDRSGRLFSFGMFFGYPREAVDFFVVADQEKVRTGRFVERDFRSVPVYSGSDGAFVWAIPKGAPITQAEKEIQHEAAKVLKHYKTRRDRWIPRQIELDAPPSFELLREWYCGDNPSDCRRPQHQPSEN